VRVKKQGLLNINGKFRKKVLRNDLNIWFANDTTNISRIWYYR
jgi:hypothetical protein